MKCETCKCETEALCEENGLFFCSVVCYSLYLQVTGKWTEPPLIPLKEGIDVTRRKTIH